MLAPLGNFLADDLEDTVAAEAAYRAGTDAGDANCHHNLALLLLEDDRADEALTHLRGSRRRRCPGRPHAARGPRPPRRRISNSETSALS